MNNLPNSSTNSKMKRAMKILVVLLIFFVFSFFLYFHNSQPNPSPNKISQISHVNVEICNDNNANKAEEKQFKVGERKRWGYVWYSSSDEYTCAVLVAQRRLRTLSPQDSFNSIDYLVIIEKGKVSERLIDKMKEEGMIVKEETAPKISNSNQYYSSCFLKLFIFTYTEYDRLIYMDADGLAMKDGIEELFHLPEVVKIAAPWGYWENQPCLSSIFLVLTPSLQFFCDRLLPYLSDTPQRRELDNMMGRVMYDMDILNYVLGDMRVENGRILAEVMMLPYPYGVLTTAWILPSHLQSIKDPIIERGKKDDYKELQETAVYIHFSRGGKPWAPTPDINRSPFLIDLYAQWNQLANQICY